MLHILNGIERLSSDSFHLLMLLLLMHDFSEQYIQLYRNIIIILCTEFYELYSYFTFLDLGLKHIKQKNEKINHKK